MLNFLIFNNPIENAGIPRAQPNPKRETKRTEKSNPEG